jgi:glycosyltransferase involved in cell wall biosynthesis
MAKPLISLIVPVYNVEPFLGRCFESILKQTYKNLEIILIDDGSTDGCGKLCDQFANNSPNIIVKHQKNAGLSAARNTGLNLANGDYITFLDSDDYLAPDYVEYLYDLATVHDAPISVCSHYECKENGELRIFDKNASDEVFSTKTALYHMLNEQGFMLSSWGKLYRRSLFESTPKVRFPKDKLHEDVGTTYRLFLNAYKIDSDTKVVFGSQPKYCYSLRSNSITNRGFDPRKLDLISQTDTMCDEIEAIFPDLKNTTNLRRIHARFSILRQAKTGRYLDPCFAYIKEHKDWVTKNPEATKRDKLALASLKLGKPVFNFSWRIYEFLFK